MNHEQNHQRYISLQEASALTPYSQDYLSLRARQGKLKAVKQGRNWVTTQEWVHAYISSHACEDKLDRFQKVISKQPTSESIKEQTQIRADVKYISLQEASALTPYSQDYLSLRARQGKLKAVKKHKSWLTTEEWVRSYILTHSWDDKLNKFQQNHNAHITGNLPVIIAKDEISKTILNSFLSGRLTFVKKYQYHLSFACIGFFIFISALLVLIPTPWADKIHGNLNTQPGQIAGEKIESPTILEKMADMRSVKLIVYLAQTAFKTKDFYTLATLTTIDDFRYSIGQSRVFLAKWFVRENIDIVAVTTRTNVKRPKSTVNDQTSDVVKSLPEDQGLIVVPLDNQSVEAVEELKVKIKKSFSDEIQVEPDEIGDGGIIRPIFREPTDQQYLYLMVPVVEKEATASASNN